MRKWLLAVALAFALAACTTPGKAPTKTDLSAPVSTDISELPDTTLKVWTSEGRNRLVLLRKLATEFEAAHPNVKVKWTIRDFGAYPAQIKLALSSSDGPDVAIGNLGWSLDGPLIKAGLFRPLDDYAKAYGWDKRYPDVGLRQLKFSHDGKVYGEGSIWGTPYAADVIGWFYNADMLKALGKEVPKTLAELEDVLAASKAAGQQPIILGNKDAWPAWHLLYNLVDQYATKKEITDIVYGGADANYANKGMVAALDKMLEWKKAGYVSADVNAVAQADASAAFLKGKALFFPAGSWEAASMPENYGFFLTPPLEAGTPPRATGSFGYAFHVAANSKHVAAGAAFLDWMSNEAAAKKFFAAGDIAPMTVPDAKIKVGKVFADIFDSWTEVLNSDGLLPYLEFATPRASEVQYPQLQEVLAGKTSPEAALKAMEADRSKFVAENK